MPADGYTAGPSLIGNYRKQAFQKVRNGRPPFGSLTYSASASAVCGCSIDLVIPHITLLQDEASRVKQHGATSKLQFLTEHIHFINHQAKQVLLLDLANCSAAEVGNSFRAVPEFVTSRPSGLVLILSDFTGASFDLEAIRVMKETAVFDKPYVNKSAWTGTKIFPEAFAESISRFSRREFHVFETRKEALAWLAEE